MVLYQLKIIILGSLEHGNTTDWRSLPDQIDPYDNKQIKAATIQLLATGSQASRNGLRSTLLKACRSYLGIDTLVCLPMKYSQRSRLIRWRLGSWMPNGRRSYIC
ncbi:hypothetical protein INT45_002921 [Circinella minor]|uniref:Uncharacterized protein n=1 Tax=Circinella minor TaxID=1195481 RepID=A0A8H7RIL9_9FUNG|nr:hypothetical protein INT45_002921 [Circinella minor]